MQFPLSVNNFVKTNLSPNADAVQDLGAVSPNRWRNLFLSGSATIGTNAEVAGNVNINGTAPVNQGWLFFGNDLVNADIPTHGITTTFVFLDSTTGQLSVKKDTGGTISLEASAAGGDSWGDPVDANIIPDLTTNQRDLGSISNQFNNLWAAGQVSAGIVEVNGTLISSSGNLQMNNKPIQQTGNITPNAAGASDIGSSSLEYNDIYLDGNVIFRGLGDTPAATEQYVRGTSTSMQFNIRATPIDTDYSFRKASLEQLRISMNVGAGNNESIIRAAGGKHIGFHPDTSNGIGTEGALGIPFRTGSASSAANADTHFGAYIGAFGVYLSSGGTPIMVIRRVDGDWATLIMDLAKLS